MLCISSTDLIKAPMVQSRIRNQSPWVLFLLCPVWERETEAQRIAIISYSIQMKIPGCSHFCTKVKPKHH